MCSTEIAYAAMRCAVRTARRRIGPAGASPLCTELCVVLYGPAGASPLRTRAAPPQSPFAPKTTRIRTARNPPRCHGIAPRLWYDRNNNNNNNNNKCQHRTLQRRAVHLWHLSTGHRIAGARLIAEQHTQGQYGHHIAAYARSVPDIALHHTRREIGEHTYGKAHRAGPDSSRRCVSTGHGLAAYAISVPHIAQQNLGMRYPGTAHRIAAYARSVPQKLQQHTLCQYSISHSSTLYASTAHRLSHSSPQHSLCQYRTSRSSSTYVAMLVPQIAQPQYAHRVAESTSVPDMA
eukprot:2410918-Rhodomonas_salina.3